MNYKRQKPRRKVRGPGFSERPMGNAVHRDKVKYRTTTAKATQTVTGKP